MLPHTSTSSLIVTASMLWCQTATAPPRFEVASVRLNQTEVRGGSMDFSPGGERFSMTNMPLGALILVAYDITVRQISGPPGFLGEKYDITAKTEHPVKPSEVIRMLRALLEDRFKLVMRRETRQVPVYFLTVAKGGPKLRESAAPEGVGTALRIPSRAGGTEPASGHLVFRKESMPDFAWALSRMAGIGDRVVIDKTGLAGSYDFELTFAQDTAPRRHPDLPESATLSDRPSLFSALPEQLGLKLESRKAAVDFLVIDHIERPSEN